jgi:hypothetical protein
VKPAEIRVEAFLGFEIDVERNEVDARPEILRRRIVHVRDETPGILCLHRPKEPVEEALHRLPAMPADDRRRNLVANGIAEHCGVAGTGSHALAHATLDVIPALRIVEEGDVLLPRQPNHDAQPEPRSRVE